MLSERFLEYVFDTFYATTHFREFGPIRPSTATSIQDNYYEQEYMDFAHYNEN